MAKAPTEHVYLLSVIANYHENGDACDECPPDYEGEQGATCPLWQQAKAAIAAQDSNG